MRILTSLVCHARLQLQEHDRVKMQQRLDDAEYARKYEERMDAEEERRRETERKRAERIGESLAPYLALH